MSRPPLKSHPARITPPKPPIVAKLPLAAKPSASTSPSAAARKKTPEAPNAHQVGAIFTLPDALAAAPLPSAARERILHAAVSILNEEGFGALTQTRVAEQAGVRQSHITYYFPARNDLLRETAVYGCNVLLEMLSGSVETGSVTLDTARDFFVTDISDRRFARLMCALIVASDEDEHIKLWLASFEDINRKRLLDTFLKLGLKITLEDVENFHCTYVGAVMLDLGESTNASLTRTGNVMRRAFDDLMQRGMAAHIKTATKNITKTNTNTGNTKKRKP